jgi:hypothetical protein
VRDHGAVSADPARYRQSLLDAVTDDGLEELTLSLARPAYPQAYRTGRGSDGGVDVLSDLEMPPARAWQCKNGKPNWDGCRESLRTAMSDTEPEHYTFVFPRPLTQRQLTWWRTKFVLEQRALYPNLETLDLWDDLADRLADRPELIDRLSEGALASSYSAVARAASQTGVNPFASAADLVGDAPELARRAVETGRADPRYRYENRQREARADDRTIPEGRIRFGFEAQIGRPRSFTATIRVGDAVQEKAAEPREQVPLEQVTPWFADAPAAAAHRDRIRSELAAGRTVDVACDSDVGVDAGPLPDRFVAIADADGILRNGDVTLGLSEPLTLEVGMDGDADAPLPSVRLSMYRIPSDPGYSVSFGGSFHGALVFLDLDPDAQAPDGDSRKWTDTSIAVAIDPDGVQATELVTGLGFVLSFSRANRLTLACDGLLPPEGMDLDITDHGIAAENAEILEHAMIVAAVLAQLTRLDGRPRTLGPVATKYDRAIADLVGELLRYREIRTPLTGSYRYRAPADAGDPGEVMRGFRQPLGQLAGQPTVVAEMRIDGDADGRLIEMDGVTVLEATPKPGARAEVVMALVGPVPADPDGDGANSPA